MLMQVCALQPAMHRKPRSISQVGRVKWFFKAFLRLCRVGAPLLPHCIPDMARKPLTPSSTTSSSL